MKVDVTTVGSFQKQLVFQVPPDQVANRIDQAYKRLGDRVRMPGFRPGKTPRKVLEARYAPQIEAEVANDLIQASFRDAIVSHNLVPVGQPSVADSSPIAATEGFRFTITVEVKPEIELTGYTGVDVAYPQVEVTAEEVDKAVSGRLASKARLEQVEGRPVQAGDLAMVELTVRDGDQVVAQEPGTMIHTASDPYYPGIEEHLVGLAIGEEKSASVTFAEGAKTAAVAGKTLDAAMKIVMIQSLTPPQLDDALAAELGYEGGAAAMRAAIEAQLRSGREELARNQARANLIEAVIAKNPFDVPQPMVEDSLRMLMQELRLQTAIRTGRDPKTIGFSEAQVQDLRVRSVFAAKAALIIDWVAKKEAIEVEEKDLEARYAQLAQERDQTVEAVRGWFQKESEAASLRERVREEKVLDWLLERANLLKGGSAP